MTEARGCRYITIQLKIVSEVNLSLATYSRTNYASTRRPLRSGFASLPSPHKSAAGNWHIENDRRTPGMRLIRSVGSPCRLRHLRNKLSTCTPQPQKPDQANPIRFHSNSRKIMASHRKNIRWPPGCASKPLLNSPSIKIMSSILGAVRSVSNQMMWVSTQRRLCNAFVLF
ncbi:hypothetical protein P171DRAFT_138626 [Karstenula rhodostoma CBS 690.94]|uniref:Uncharacterized protein n=1 Tax=Karstenula rhodostoma CBS 690.94 TaxID=1392251 RepID=A0A9P4PUB1_9PLEO|nr:hypothetical protein P171DRAFT_138626 [Karstenula rhodostoma CBS 690.94]